jgi:hypothetical protein
MMTIFRLGAGVVYSMLALWGLWGMVLPVAAQSGTVCDTILPSDIINVTPDMPQGQLQVMMFERGIVNMLRDGQFDLAYPLSLEAITLMEDDHIMYPVMYFHHGCVLLYLERPTEAIEYFQEYLRYENNNSLSRRVSAMLEDLGVSDAINHRMPPVLADTRHLEIVFEALRGLILPDGEMLLESESFRFVGNGDGVSLAELDNSYFALSATFTPNQTDALCGVFWQRPDSRTDVLLYFPESGEISFSSALDGDIFNLMPAYVPNILREPQPMDLFIVAPSNEAMYVYLDGKLMLAVPNEAGDILMRLFMLDYAYPDVDSANLPTCTYENVTLVALENKLTPCEISTTETTNRYARAGSLINIVGQLTANDAPMLAFTQTLDNGGMVWLQLVDETWVRADSVMTSGDCQKLPDALAP